MSSLGSHAALTAEESKIIEDFGFGSLLQFNRCFVPKKFAQWVVRLVNYRSRDIVLNGKVISLTRESVNVVLGIPLTDKPFPDDYSVGKSIILSKFGKHFIPSVSFFAERLTKHVPMSDEDTFICFIIVAMNSFLCSNASLYYLKILEMQNYLISLDTFWIGWLKSSRALLMVKV